YVATGHYARIGTGTDGQPILLRGMEPNDQSYMLARLPRPLLSHILFPLGDVAKTVTREQAAGEGLHNAQRPDSMDICFVPDQDYAAWLDRRGGTPPPGNFVDAAGNVLGKHKGYHHYTIGQRRGLGVSSTGRLFVSAIRPERNEVVLSHGEGLHADRVVCSQLNWLAEGALDAPRAAQVRLRHSRHSQQATLIPLENGGVELQLDRPARAPTPGQLAVFYHGEQVLGSGWIERQGDADSSC
ncbi:MAG TPA: tRNA 2-thiouridine(34) synthase MnmA, partial [Clostridiales bacterium]|nr:tRNA 2-thiouridine(34) synthase MnmA [Clostridiales bacterium]